LPEIKLDDESVDDESETGNITYWVFGLKVAA
jgi:hypothetical protein